MITDVRPYTKISGHYMKYIEPRRLELAELMANREGRTTKIKVTTPVEPRLHVFQAGYHKGLCYCVDCYGDFRDGSSDED
jgi:hypothetical protein